MTPLKKNLLSKIAIVFLVFSIATLLFRKFLIGHAFDTNFLLSGNLFLFIIFFISMNIHAGAASSANNHAFLRSINLTMIIKLFATAIAVVIYSLMNNGNINSYALLTLLALYVIYTTLEVSTLMKAARKKNV